MNNEYNKKVTGLRPSTWAMAVGVFWALVGLAVAILWSVSTTVEHTQDTNSLLAGLTFGVAAGIVAIIVVPLIYFGIGWVVGFVQGFIFNVVLGGSGGVAIQLEDEK